MPSTASNRARHQAGSISPTMFLWLGTAILLVAALMRLVALRDIPPGLSQDEILDADIVRFIWQGQHAFFFREGYGHEPLFHYLAAPFQLLLGDNLLAIRLPPGFAGLLLVAAMMRWVGKDYGRLTGLLAGSFVAISWWAIIFSRVGIRPILLPLLLVGVGYFWPYPGRSDRRRVVLSGLFLGLSLYSYTAAQAVLLLPAAYFAYLLLLRWWARRRNHTAPTAIDSRALLAPVAVLAIALLLVTPMLLTWWADPTLLQRVDQLSGPLDSLRAGDPGPLFESTLATLGVFAFTGDPRITYMMPGVPLLDPLTALCFAIGVGIALVRGAGDPAYGLPIIWLLIGLLPSALTPQAPSTIRLIGALPVVYLIPALTINRGLEFAAQRMGDRRRVVTLLGGLFVALLLVGNLARTLRDGFMRWPNDLETRMRYQAVLRDIAVELDRPGSGEPVIAEAFFEPIDHDSLRRNLGYDLQARWVQQQHALVLPAGGSGRLYVPEYASLDVALFEAAGMTSEPLFRSRNSPSYGVYNLPASAAMPQLAESITFDGMFTLLGVQLLPSRESGELPVLTLWRVESALPEDMAIFVHLTEGDGRLVAQDDALDAAPATLQPGDLVLQLHLIQLPERLPEAGLGLELGLYRRGDGSRLMHPGTPPDRILLDWSRVDEG